MFGNKLSEFYWRGVGRLLSWNYISKCPVLQTRSFISPNTCISNLSSNGNSSIFFDRPNLHAQFFKPNILYAQLRSYYPVSKEEYDNGTRIVLKIQKILSTNKTDKMREDELRTYRFQCTETLVKRVLYGRNNDWKTAYFFFRYVSTVQGFTHTTATYNLMVEILGRGRCLTTMWQLVVEMHNQKPLGSLVSNATFAILVEKYASAHLVEKAIEAFDKRVEFGLMNHVHAFRYLLMCLCRHGHVQAAQTFQVLRRRAFPADIFSWTIILNGWCHVRNFSQARRVWNLIVKYHNPDVLSFSVFLKALLKEGKIQDALSLVENMSKGSRRRPNTHMLNMLILGLCSNRRMTQALEIFEDMKKEERKSRCKPDVITYNILIKCLCMNRMADKAHQLFDEMEASGHVATIRTFQGLFRFAKSTDEIQVVLDKMEKRGVKLLPLSYLYLVTRYIRLDEWKKVYELWDEMKQKGISPHARIYTVMVHGLFHKGMYEEAIVYYKEMVKKGLYVKARTLLYVRAIEGKLCVKVNQKMLSQRQIKEPRSEFREKYLEGQKQGGVPQIAGNEEESQEITDSGIHKEDK